MNGDTLYALRNALDADEKWMAEKLGLSGKNVTQTIHDMEKDRKPISGPLRELIPRIARENGFELVNGKWERI